MPGVPIQSWLLCPHELSSPRNRATCQTSSTGSATIPSCWRGRHPIMGPRVEVTNSRILESQASAVIKRFRLILSTSPGKIKLLLQQGVPIDQVTRLVRGALSTEVREAFSLKCQLFLSRASDQPSHAGSGLKPNAWLICSIGLFSSLDVIMRLSPRSLATRSTDTFKAVAIPMRRHSRLTPVTPVLPSSGCSGSSQSSDIPTQLLPLRAIWLQSGANWGESTFCCKNRDSGLLR